MCDLRRANYFLAGHSIRAYWLPRSLSFALLFVITACSSVSHGPDRAMEIAPLQLVDRAVTVDDVAFLAPTPDLLALDEEMKSFVARYTEGLSLQRQRLINLHRAIKSAGVLSMRYDPAAEGSAQEAFYSGTVNCLSYAHLLVALAREAGLNAQYQWVDVRPRWSRMGERVTVGLHVNVTIKMRGGLQYMADIDPLESRDITGTHVISDSDAQALYHSNIAMRALAEESLVDAWAHAVRALQLNDEMPHLWVNLGAVYRQAGQHDVAEQSYFYALSLDSRDRSAMNNLAVLYKLQARDEESAYWQAKIGRYQDSNPYYHAWQGDKLGETGNWAAALTHYQRAVLLAPSDSRLLYATGLIHYQLEDYDAASTLISEAIDLAPLRREKDSYQIQLDAVRAEQLAAL
ncbi:MAG: tetratricopeptide repeat protein [Halioglobus sp.]